VETLRQNHFGIREDLSEAFKKNQPRTNDKPSLDKIWRKHFHPDEHNKTKRQSFEYPVVVPSSFDWRDFSQCRSLRDIPYQQMW